MLPLLLFQAWSQLRVCTSSLRAINGISPMVPPHLSASSALSRKSGAEGGLYMEPANKNAQRVPYFRVCAPTMVCFLQREAGDSSLPAELGI